MTQRHSKRSTALAFFTSHERSQITEYGTKRVRLAAETYRLFDDCHLCLSQAKDPVCCAKGGHIFCRECIIANLLLQREQHKQEAAAVARRERDSAIARAKEAAKLEAERIEKWEHSQKLGKDSQPDTKKQSTPTRADLSGSLFWTPAAVPIGHGTIDDAAKLAPKTESGEAIGASVVSAPSKDKQKQTTICPASSDDDQHPVSLKTLVSVVFANEDTERGDDKDAGSERVQRLCPACRRQFSNAVASVVVRNCGHVFCKSCATKFIVSSGRCFTCDSTISIDDQSKKKKQSSFPPLVPLFTEGTGYSAHKDAEAKRERVAFRSG